MKRFLIAAGAACLLAGCTAAGALTPQATVALQVACQVDGAVQPIAAGVVSGLSPAGATIASADSLMVHPAVVAACAKIGGTPVVGTPTGASATGIVTVTVPAAAAAAAAPAAAATPAVAPPAPAAAAK